MRITLLILIISSCCLFANQPDSLKTKKWAIGLTYSPDYCYRVSYTKANNNGSTNVTEKGKMGFTTGLNFRYQLMERIGIEFGALYSTKGQKVTTPAYSWTTPGNGVYDPSIPNNNTTLNVSQSERKITYTYQYLEIPLKVNVYLINNRFKVFPSIGCSANIFMGKKTTEQYDGKKETSNKYYAKNIPTAEFAILAGIGLSYDVNKKIFVKLEPSFRSFIRPLVDAPISGTMYSLGANVGVYFNL